MNRYDFILQTLKKAGDMLLELRQGDVEVGIKDGNIRDVVTDVDIKLSEFITNQIAEAFPDEQIYSEETGSDDITQKSFWTIDPVDGTSNFSRNIPHFAICITYIENGTPVVGGAFNPVTNEMYSAEKGKGAFLNGKKVEISTIHEPKKSMVCTNAGRSDELRIWSHELYGNLLKNIKSVKNLGSSALDFCFVGSGSVDACLYAQLTPFDIAFAKTFIEEAGGVIVNEKYEPMQLSFEKQTVYAFNSKELMEAMKPIIPTK